MKRKICIGVIGASECSEKEYKIAQKVGEEIARSGAALVCGGLGGTMQAACWGAKEAGGTTIGIIPGTDKKEANRYLDYVIVTGLADARNVIVVRTSDAVIALPGSFGTLSELAFALKFGIPVISLGNWKDFKPVIKAGTPQEAVEVALKSVRYT